MEQFCSLSLSSAERLSQFNVGLSNNSPDLVPPDPSNYQVWSYQESAAPLVLTLHGNETSPVGRYLIIQILRTESLCLCEVEVYIGMFFFSPYIYFD